MPKEMSSLAEGSGLKISASCYKFVDSMVSMLSQRCSQTYTMRSKRSDTSAGDTINQRMNTSIKNGIPVSRKQHQTSAI
jgi:hypothetical protein